MIPANDPIPGNECAARMPKGEFILLLGSSTFGTQVFPHVVLRVAGIDRIIIDKAADGGIAITTEIFSADGMKLATLDKNNFEIRSNYSLKMDRPDRSTLIIYDESNQKILDAHYLNATTFSLQGTLHFPGAQFVAQSGTLIVGNNNRISSMCVQGARADIVVGR
jgi:hypothetical protein